ncbi:MAG: SH3 domain-containing protein [Saprospiraceae bacterium]|nr:SH3 domain-containing protein [Saprospiraceae bacterium]
MLPITLDLLTNTRNRPFLRDAKTYSIRGLKGVVAHWTANTDKGAHAKANRNYFNNTSRFASAHYLVDDHSIIQCIPDNEVGYHVGAMFYKADGERIKEGVLTPNYFLVGFEMCVNSDGKWEKTYRNSVELAAHLLHKYELTIHDLYRHFDITGKDCPKMMLEETKWAAFKEDIAKEMAKIAPVQSGKGRVTSSELNVRSGPGVQNGILSKLKKDDSVRYFEENNGWLRIGNGRWVSQKYIETIFTTRRGQIVDPTGANVRSGPGGGLPVIDALPNGVLVRVTDQQGDWSELGEGRWVHSKLIQPLTSQVGTVVGTNELNTRQGPGTTFKILRKLDKGDVVDVFEKQDKWLRIGQSEWVFNQFISLV